MRSAEFKRGHGAERGRILIPRTAYTALTLILFVLLWCGDAWAIDLNDINSPVIEVFLLISFLSFLPAVLIMVTSFTRIVVVLSFLRHAFGGQSVPPNTVIIGLSLFLTFNIMSPTISAVNERAITPYMEEELSIGEAVSNAVPPLKEFMLKQTRVFFSGFLPNHPCRRPSFLIVGSKDFGVAFLGKRLGHHAARLGDGEGVAFFVAFKFIFCTFRIIRHERTIQNLCLAFF